MTTPKETATPRTLEDVYEDALKLSPEERANLVAMLNQGCPQAAAAAKIDKAWADELRRRVELLRAGQMATVSAGEAIQQARARLAAGRK
jgi:putative addiction module component (TIGR02574 family)